ncbi:SMI1/KNR4 family protein [Pendulispora rubella]|uniref:SMI1/KNR4 family protein n=1 Tax=Pendulispora rubella TaxID=2741070 RepID=A0ABZ2KSY9_9BACT
MSDDAAMAALVAREQKLGISLPASFVEWYGMLGGIELLQRNSNCDNPVPIVRLGASLDGPWDDPTDCVAEGLLIFMVENQGVCVWAVQLGRSDDPPVLVACDPDYEWQPCAETFSSFIECQIWDHAEILADTTPHARMVIQAQDLPLRSDDLAFLRRNFTERTTTRGWPGDIQYRFEHGETRLLLWDGEDQADWWICARTSENLTEIVEKLWYCGDLRATLWSNDPRAEEVLQNVRASKR